MTRSRTDVSQGRGGGGASLLAQPLEPQAEGKQAHSYTLARAPHAHRTLALTPHAHRTRTWQVPTSSLQLHAAVHTDRTHSYVYTARASHVHVACTPACRALPAAHCPSQAKFMQPSRLAPTEEYERDPAKLCEVRQAGGYRAELWQYRYREEAFDVSGLTQCLTQAIDAGLQSSQVSSQAAQCR